MNFEELRQKYHTFRYGSYGWKIAGENMEISFDFCIEPDIYFKPEIIIKNINKEKISSLNRDVIDNLVFHLGMVEILSYWKSTCSQKILIECANLTKEQTNWFSNLLINGMGQYFYENKIDWREKDFVEIISAKNKKAFAISSEKISKRILVAIGGGKDSAVSLEILKNSGMEIGTLCLNVKKPSLEIIKISETENSFFTERKIDVKLLELNRQGFLNGHTPFSAYLAFLSVLIGYIFDYKYLAFSNEGSSNVGNVEYLGKMINHQYSKTFDFEKKFRSYCKKYILKNAEYLSFLRPLYEIQIAKIFSKYPKYFNVFLSCNEAYRTNSGQNEYSGKWCGKCSKCLFAFIVLYPFIERKNIIKIFSQNLFKKNSLIPVLEELSGQKRFKPFECVGTKEEVLVALYLSLEKEKSSQKIPALLDYFRKNVLTRERGIKRKSKTIFKAWDKNNFLGKNFKKILKNEIR